MHVIYRRKQKGKEKVEKEIARTLATKKLFSHSEFVSAKNGHSNGTECPTNKLKSTPANLHQNSSATTDIETHQKDILRKEIRYV